MKIVIMYLFFLIILLPALGLYLYVSNSLTLISSLSVPIYCGIIGGLGGVTYCLRAVYLNASVEKNWDKDWIPWYFIRPLVSIVCGVVSFAFLKAGLLILEAEQTTEPTNMAYYALAFIAGLNVDKFINKVEEIAENVWGIKKSRTALKGEEK